MVSLTIYLAYTVHKYISWHLKFQHVPVLLMLMKTKTGLFIEMKEQIKNKLKKYY